MSNGIIYLVQPMEYIGSNCYKVGCSGKPTLERVTTGYKKGTTYLLIMNTIYPFVLEKKIKKIFNTTFKLIAGYEYFEGDAKKMIDIIINLKKEHDINIINIDKKKKYDNYEKQCVIDVNIKKEEQTVNFNNKIFELFNNYFEAGTNEDYITISDIIKNLKKDDYYKNLPNDDKKKIKKIYIEKLFNNHLNYKNYFLVKNDKLPNRLINFKKITTKQPSQIIKKNFIDSSKQKIFEIFNAYFEPTTNNDSVTFADIVNILKKNEYYTSLKKIEKRILTREYIIYLFMNDCKYKKYYLKEKKTTELGKKIYMPKRLKNFKKRITPLKIVTNEFHTIEQISISEFKENENLQKTTTNQSQKAEQIHILEFKKKINPQKKISTIAITNQTQKVEQHPILGFREKIIEIFDTYYEPSYSRDYVFFVDFIKILKKNKYYSTLTKKEKRILTNENIIYLFMNDCNYKKYYLKEKKTTKLGKKIYLPKRLSNFKKKCDVDQNSVIKH